MMLLPPIATCDTHGISSQPRPEGESSTKKTNPEWFESSPPAEAIFSRSQLRGTQGVRVDTTAQVRVSAGFPGAFSGPSNSPILANDNGEPCPPARDKQAHGYPLAVIVPFFHHYCLLLVLKYRSSPQRLDSEKVQQQCSKLFPP